METQKQTIESFLTAKKIAVAGASRNPKKFGNQVLDNFLKKGYEAIPVNPNATDINGITCYSSVSALPDDVKHLLIVTPKNETLAVIKDAISKGIQNIWIQQMSETKEAIAAAKQANINLITRKCAFMFTEPVDSIHKFHRAIKKFFGTLYN